MLFCSGHPNTLHYPNQPPEADDLVNAIAVCYEISFLQAAFYLAGAAIVFFVTSLMAAIRRGW